MTYHERDHHTSQFPLYHHPHRSQQQQQQQPQLHRVLPKIFNNRNNRSFPPRHSPPQVFRVECKAEERHFIRDSSQTRIRSPLQPIRVTMNDQYKPIQFRSEIIVHNNPETDVHIKSLRVAFHYHDETPAEALAMHQPDSVSPSPTPRPTSTRTKKPSPPPSPPPPVRPTAPTTITTTTDENRTVRNLEPALSGVFQPSSQALLHQWIDDICANEALMANDDIVFFIKHGEFFARI